MLDLWLTAVVPLETPYETLKALSLSESPNSGFASSLPFLYENVARLVLIRSQQMGIDRGLDPLGAVVRLLSDRRVGAHPDVIPIAASSKDYLDRIVERLEGPESDAGSLTFTLALFEATKLHDTARGLLATEGLSTETVKAIRVAGAAYRTAENRADTVSGQAAVQTRVLRQLGEIYAAKQRLKVDPEIETPFTIEDAVLVYTKLADAEADGSWEDLGFTYARRLRRRDARPLGGHPGGDAQRGGLLPVAQRRVPAPLRRVQPQRGAPLLALPRAVPEVRADRERGGRARTRPTSRRTKRRAAWATRSCSTPRIRRPRRWISASAATARRCGSSPSIARSGRRSPPRSRSRAARASSWRWCGRPPKPRRARAS